MHPGFDVDAYCERIGLTRPRKATLDTLAAIQLRHAQTIPFENLNPLLGWPVRLDAATLEEKLIRGGRGGYCFEQNLLLSHALNVLGFHVTGLAARVLWNVPEGRLTPRGHMLLLVDLDDEAYVADVGFGGMTPTAPLRLGSDVEQRTPHEPFRLVRHGNMYTLQVKVGELWNPLYRFDLQEQFLADYEVANWYLSNHPESHFVTGLVAARPAVDERYALRDNVLSIHYVNGPTERRLLTSASELHATLRDLFHVRVPDTPEVRRAFKRLASGRPTLAASRSDVEELARTGNHRAPEHVHTQ
jgi:N-hydroxyarylamine O-acetyltransferase